MPIKIREVKDKNSHCLSCNTNWSNTPIMFDIGFISGSNSNIITLCKKCSDELFQKLLKSSCNYNAKVKDKVDMERIRRSKREFMPKGEKWVIEEEVKTTPKKTRTKTKRKIEEDLDDEWEDVLKEEISVKKVRRNEKKKRS